MTATPATPHPSIMVNYDNILLIPTSLKINIYEAGWTYHLLV